MATKKRRAKKGRCWPGYEPVPGKQEHEKGSCRPKASSKLRGGEKRFRAKRKRQLDRWQANHPGARRQAAQHLHAPGERTKTSRKKKRSASTARPKRRPAKREAAA